MLNRAKTFMMKLFQGSVEYLLVFPLILAIGIKYVYIHDLYLWLSMFVLLYGIGMIIGIVLQKQRQWFYVLVILVISAGSAYFFWDERLLGFALTLALFFSAIYRGLLNTQKEWSDIFSIPYLWGLGFPIYFLSYFFFAYQNLYSQYLDLLTVITLIFIVFTLFISNSETLKHATLSKQKKPYINQGIKRRNYFFIVVTIIMIILISSFGVLHLLLGYLGTFIYLAYRFLRSIQPFEEDGQQQPAGGGFNDGGLPELEIRDPSKFALFLDQVTTYLAFTFYTFVVIMFIFFCFKRIWGIQFKQIFRSILRFFSHLSFFRFKQEEDDHYTEEKESVFNLRDWSDNNKQKFKEYFQKVMRREVQWSKLSDQEKVRHVYRSLVELQIKEGYQFQASKTPSEVIADLNKSVTEHKLYDQLNVTYMKARYADAPVHHDELKTLRQLLQKKKK